MRLYSARIYFTRLVIVFLVVAIAGIGAAVMGSQQSVAQAATTHVASHGDTTMIEERDWYVPEGCTRPGFDTWVLVQNPDGQPATVTMQFQLPVGQSASPYSFELAANTRQSIHLNELAGLAGTDVSTHVSATKRVIVEQSMYFDYQGKKGGNDSLASPCPYPTWYFAEGYTGGEFDTWVLVQNPLEQEATVTLEFQLPDGATAPAHVFKLAPKTRHSVKLDDLEGLSSTDVSTKLTSTVPVVAERAMYFDNQGRRGGSSSSGVIAPGSDFFLSEGYTGDSFDTWVLLQNPADEQANVNLEFQLADGRTAEGVGYALAPKSRKTVLLDDVPGLANSDVSTHITSDKPVIAERAMYFDYYGRDGGDCASAVDAPNNTWYLPEGYTGQGFDTWILVQNPSDRTARVRLQFQGAPGYAIPPHDIEVAANSRETVLLNAIPGFPATDVATTVISDVPVTAERSVYFDNKGIDGGTCCNGYRPNELMDNAIILDDESVALIDGTADSQAPTVAFTGRSELLKSVRIGDIIIAGSSPKAPEGFLWKVGNLMVAGQGVSFTTEQASVTEAVKYGNFFSNAAGSTSGAAPRSTLADISYNLDTGTRSVSFKNITAAARVQLNGDLYLNLSIGVHWKWHIIPIPYLKYFQVENDMHAALTFDADADPGTISGSKTIYTYEFSPVVLGPLVFLPRLRINLGVSGNPSTHCDFGVVGQVKDLDAGIVYDGSWHTPHNLEVGGSITRWDPPAGGDITVYVEEEFDFLLYGVVGPYVSMQEGPHFHVNQAENPWWTLGMMIKAKAGVDISVFKIIDIKFDATIYDTEIPIAHAPYRPVLKSMKPTSGNVWSSVTLTGSYFGSPSGDSYVSFGGTRATSVTSWTDTQIVCDVPPGAAGVVPVKVTTKGGTSGGIDFSVIPWLDHLSSDSGPPGTPVTLFGSGFGGTQGTSFVSFGGTRAVCTSWKDDQVTCTVPAGLSGVVQISLTTAGGTSRQLPFGVVPKLAGLDPDAGVVGSQVTLTGSAFGPTQGGSYVSFGDTKATDYASWADGRVVVTVPSGVSGALKVTLTTAGGTSNALDFGVIPRILGLDPASGTVSTQVTVSGTGFGQLQGASTVAFGNTGVTEYVSWSDTQIVCQVPMGAGGKTAVTVTTTGGKSAPATFKVIPTITGLDPGSGVVGSTVTISGNAFVQGNSFVSFGGVRATQYVSWAYDRVVCRVPLGASGVAPVTLTTSGGTSNALDFKVIPTLTSIAPPQGEIGDTVTLTGNAFGGSQGSSFVAFGPAMVTSPVSWSDTSITLKVPDGTWGTVPVTVTTAGGVSNTVPFGIVPTMGGVQPDGGTVGSAVTVSGNGFGPQQEGSVVAFGDTVATEYASWSDEQVVCNVPLGAAGIEQVTLTTSGGTSAGAPFGVIPTITSVAPPSSQAGTKVVISGNAFGGVQGGSYVSFGQWRASAISSWSDQRIECTVPAEAAGEVELAVTTAGGRSAPFEFGVLPYISKLNPSAGGAGSVLTVSGSGFGASRGSSMVLFGGTPVASYRGWGDTWIKCVVPQGPTGGAISVVTSGGVSNSRDFTVLTPTWYLAEGTSAWGFSTYITIENPNGQQVSADVTFMTPTGPHGYPPIKLPPTSQTTIVPREMLGFETDFSTRVVCVEGKTIAVDRTMQWTGPGAVSPEGHCSIGATAPAKTWYMPEGVSSFGFETWLLIQNPNNTEADCTVTYMIEGVGPKTLVKKVPANSRRSYDMVDDIGQEQASIELAANIPVIAERATYRNLRREGQESLGTTLPAHGYYGALQVPTSQDCYLAEGSTNYGFTTYLLLQNPSSSEARVTVTYMHEGGPLPQEPVLMSPKSRKTIRVNDVLPDKDFAIHVHSSVPVAAERAMYWGAGTPRGEASHDTIAMTSLHDSYYFPDGQAGDGYETFTLVQNPSGKTVPVDVKYFSPEGKVLASFALNVPAGSRRTLNLGDKIQKGRAAIQVRCRNPQDTIMAERAMYWNGRGAGTVTIGGFEDLTP